MIATTNFQIGIYQPVVSQPFPTAPNLLVSNPFAQDYGSEGFTLQWFSIPEPRQVTHTPPQALGQDIGGFPAVRGYAQMDWNYPLLRSDSWYYLYYLWRLQRTAGQYTGHVRIQWPDPSTGTNVQASARWQAIMAAERTQPVFNNIDLLFTHIGIDDSSVVGTWAIG